MFVHRAIVWILCVCLVNRVHNFQSEPAATTSQTPEATTIGTQPTEATTSQIPVETTTIVTETTEATTTTTTTVTEETTLPTTEPTTPTPPNDTVNTDNNIGTDATNQGYWKLIILGPVALVVVLLTICLLIYYCYARKNASTASSNRIQCPSAVDVSKTRPQKSVELRGTPRSPPQYVKRASANSTAKKHDSKAEKKASSKDGQKKRMRIDSKKRSKQQQQQQSKQISTMANTSGTSSGVDSAGDGRLSPYETRIYN